MEQGPSDIWASGAAYEPYVGRWSRLVARECINWLAVPPRQRWLDLGCGTGALAETILANRPKLFLVLWGLWAVHLLRGERRQAYRLAEQLLLRGEDARDSGQLLIAHGSVGITLFEFGEYLSVREHLEKGISFYDRERHRPLGLDEFLIPQLSYLAQTLNLLGYPIRLSKGSSTRSLSQKILVVLSR
jgi:hypothetical protein